LDVFPRIEVAQADLTEERVHVLEEVTIRDSPVTRVRGSAVHLQADVVISGADLRAADNGDMLSMLQARIPGLRILAYLDRGVVRKLFKLGGIVSFGGNPLHHEPIVIVDGNVLYTDGDQTAAEQVASIRASAIDRVEVIKFGGGAAYGARGANGVIAIFTSDLEPQKRNDDIDRAKSQQLAVMGFASTKPFIPSHSASSPNATSTIYWNPRVLIDRTMPATLSFQAPDEAGAYLIIVEGVSGEGKAVRVVKLIDVR
jgi:hypothetical protein